MLKPSFEFITEFPVSAAQDTLPVLQASEAPWLRATPQISRKKGVAEALGPGTPQQSNVAEGAVQASGPAGPPQHIYWIFNEIFNNITPSPEKNCQTH